jgi:excisionase family DNA binding protein
MSLSFQTVEQQYLTKSQACTYTGLSERTLDYARERGELASYRVGKRVLFARASLDRWLDRFRVGVDGVANEVMSDLGVGK